jgi:hypothetical protein
MITARTNQILISSPVMWFVVFRRAHEERDDDQRGKYPEFNSGNDPERHAWLAFALARSTLSAGVLGSKVRAWL